MDTKPILARIEADARKAVADVLKEAENRVLSIHERSDLRLAEMKAEAQKEGRAESLRLEERMLRLSELETRKELLAAQRTLMDQAFDQALEKLRELPEEEFKAWLLKHLEQARGDEQVQAGAVNDSFYTPDFLSAANARLKELGKPGKLTDRGGRAPGVTGLVLYSQGSEMYCSLESALEQKRLDLETRLAKMLFDL